MEILTERGVKMTKQELERRKEIEKAINKLHEEHANQKILDKYQAATFLTINHLLWRWDIEGLNDIVQQITKGGRYSTPSLCTAGYALKWVKRINAEAPLADFDEITPRQMCELFKKYAPDAPADLPIFRYFGKQTQPTASAPKETKPVTVGDITPLFEPFAKFIVWNFNGERIEKGKFFELLNRPETDLLGKYIWQQLPEQVRGKQTTKKITITRLKKDYNLQETKKRSAKGWLKLFADFGEYVLAVREGKKKLEMREMCNSIKGLDENNLTNSMEQTLWKAIPPETNPEYDIMDR